MLVLFVKLKDFWLNNRAKALFDLGIVFGPSVGLLLPSFWARSSDMAFTRFSNRRLKVGYLEIDLVIPWSLHDMRNRINHKIENQRKEGKGKKKSEDPVI